MDNHQIKHIIRELWKLKIKVYEGSGEVWFDCYKNLSNEERIRVGIYSRKIQENKMAFVEFLWRRDKRTPREKEGERIVRGMLGLRGLRAI